MQGVELVREEDRLMIVSLVKHLLQQKPQDPIPFIYSYLKQKSEGIETPQLPTNLEVAEIKNLRKKYEHLKSQAGEADGQQTETEESEDEEEEEVKVPAKPRKQRAGISAEVFGAHNRKEDFRPPVFAKTDEQKEQLRTKLLQAFMFNALDQNELNIVLDAIEEVRVQSGDVVIKEGDQGDCMFVLNTGSLKCTKVFAGNTEPTFLKDYVPGEGFGELALLYNAPRAATISATSDSTLMKLDRGTFNHIVKDSAQRKREKYDNFLQSVAILESMDPYERSKLGDAVHEERYPEGEYVIKQGTAGETFYMVLEGTLKALRRGPDGIETEVMQYEPGKYFGERALLTNDLRAASIMTTSDVCVLSLERSTFMRLLGPLDDILKRNMEAYKKYA